MKKFFLKHENQPNKKQHLKMSTENLNKTPINRKAFNTVVKKSEIRLSNSNYNCDVNNLAVRLATKHYKLAIKFKIAKSCI